MILFVTRGTMQRIDSLPQLKETIPYDVKSTLVYISSYVTRKVE